MKKWGGVEILIVTLNIASEAAAFENSLDGTNHRQFKCREGFKTLDIKTSGRSVDLKKKGFSKSLEVACYEFQFAESRISSCSDPTQL